MAGSLKKPQNKESSEVNINRRAFYHVIGFIILFFFILGLFRPQVMGKEQLQEEVTVLAVEVPVRVLQKGRAVRNLTREDFEIFENGIKQQITAFEVVSRKISTPREISPEELKIPPKKRLFLLIFNIFDYNDNVGDGIDYFFEKVFWPGDKLIVLTEDRLLNIEIGKSLSSMINDLKDTLKQYKRISTKEIIRAYHKLGFEASRLGGGIEMANRSGGSSFPAILKFYKNYLTIWKEYKRMFISPDTDLYHSVINRVKQMEGEKWALCFQQRELFPKLKNQGLLDIKINNAMNRAFDPVSQNWARLVRVKQAELQRSLAYSGIFPTELLKDLFMEANITFHLILMKSIGKLMSPDFEMGEVAQDYEDCFKQISRSTGGYTTFSNKVTQALEEAVEVEDFHYLLVYTPKNKQEDKKREIKVKVNKKGVKVIHLKNFRKIKALPITISDFKSGNGTISFSINNYKQEKIEGKLTGIVDVKITLFDRNSEKVFAEAKTLNLIKEETNVALNFRALKPGYHFIIIQVIDKITTEVDVFSRNIKF